MATVGEFNVDINVNMDITETIRGLKAIQREAKRAAQALRELEAAHNKLTYEQRLEATGAIDLRDNHRVIDLGNGFVRIEPIDPTKLWKAEGSE